MTGIEWTDRSDWNPIRGCTRESEGCRNCYAEAIAARFSGPGQPFEGFAERAAGGPRWTGKVALIEDRLTLPLRWRKPARIFVNSAFDLFHESVPDEWIDLVFRVIKQSPQHTFQILTKRAAKMRRYMTDPATPARVSFEARGEWPPRNAWLGVSAEDQRRADERVPELLATPAAVRFVSAEPLLGGIDFSEWMKGRAHGDSKEHRGNRVSARAGGGTDDRSGGADMASFGATSGSLDRENESDSLRGAPASGTRHGEISDRESDDRREADDGLRAQAGLASFQRPHSERIDSQSQGRAEKGQSAVELGTGDAFRTDDPRDQSLGLSTGAQLSWVIVGGESGPNARPMHPDWPRAIRDQCAAAGVPFFFKQWGEWGLTHPDWPRAPSKVLANDGTLYDPVDLAYPDGKRRGEAIRAGHEHGRLTSIYRVGKRHAGRMLDGRTHDDMPQRSA